MKYAADRSRMSQFVASEMGFFGSRYALPFVAGSTALLTMIALLFSVFFYISQGAEGQNFLYLALSLVSLALFLVVYIVYRIRVGREGLQFDNSMIFSCECFVICAIAGFAFLRTSWMWRLIEISPGQFNRYITTVIVFAILAPLLVAAIYFLFTCVLSEISLPYTGWLYRVYTLLPISVLLLVVIGSRNSTESNALSIATFTTVLYISLMLGFAVHFLIKYFMHRYLEATPARYETFIKVKSSKTQYSGAAGREREVYAPPEPLPEKRADFSPSFTPDLEPETVREKLGGYVEDAISAGRQAAQSAAETVRNGIENSLSEDNAGVFHSRQIKKPVFKAEKTSGEAPAESERPKKIIYRSSRHIESEAKEEAPPVPSKEGAASPGILAGVKGFFRELKENFEGERAETSPGTADEAELAGAAPDISEAVGSLLQAASEPASGNGANTETARREEGEEAERLRLEAEETAQKEAEAQAERLRLEEEERAQRELEEEIERKRLEAEERERRLIEDAGSAAPQKQDSEADDTIVREVDSLLLPEEPEHDPEQPFESGLFARLRGGIKNLFNDLRTPIEGLYLESGEDDENEEAAEAGALAGELLAEAEGSEAEPSEPAESPAPIPAPEAEKSSESTVTESIIEAESGFKPQTVREPEGEREYVIGTGLSEPLVPAPAEAESFVPEDSESAEESAPLKGERRIYKADSSYKTKKKRERISVENFFESRRTRVKAILGEGELAEYKRAILAARPASPEAPAEASLPAEIATAPLEPESAEALRETSESGEASRSAAAPGPSVLAHIAAWLGFAPRTEEAPTAAETEEALEAETETAAESPAPQSSGEDESAAEAARAEEEAERRRIEEEARAYREAE
ncbi:MAG: hypothetical protein Q4B42_00885, partial [Oscillospiraceae bacterium]|nr:hypothetical protein [Oscillospiraceae bacterium]